MDLVQRYRDLRAAGHDRDKALGIIRREGAGFVMCMKAVHDVEGLSINECKAVVHRSPAWSDEYEAREAFWDEVIRILEEEASDKQM